MSEKNKRGDKGVSVEKDEFSEWFTEIMVKADLADYTSVSGCIVFRPLAYAIWERIVREVDLRFKKFGIQNAYFPLFIPERTLAREQEHVKGFVPEVAWVSEAGNKKLSERLAVRPTSEAIMYESYAKWIRSWRDLPFKLNQWNNVVRWEFKHPVPFLRTREFLWNEGHTAYATKEEAEREKDEIIGLYKEVCERFLALPSLIGRKSEKEKFAGAEYTISMEFYMPNGRCVQGPDFHYDGQNFAKAYGIEFLDREGKKQYVYQNTFAISTRMLGVMFAVHSDSKGLVLPPRIAPYSVVIVPILFEDSRQRVLKEARAILQALEEFHPVLDDREGYTPGFKFNEWELKGVPLRVEIGPDDVEKEQVVIVRRDSGKKESVSVGNLRKNVARILEDIQEGLFRKAEKLLNDHVVRVKSLIDVKKAIAGKNIAFTPLCKKHECEDQLKFDSGGAKVLNIPDKQPRELAAERCVVCRKRADYFAYVGKSY